MYIQQILMFSKNQYHPVPQQLQNFLPVPTPGLKREHANLFCVYARAGEEKETEKPCVLGTNLAALRKMRIL